MTSSCAFSGARVLLVSSSYPFHRDDFHALFVHEQAKALRQRGAHVRVLTPAVPEGRAGRERWDGVEVERFAYAGRRTLRLTGGEGIVENVRARPLAAVAAPGLVAALFGALRSACSAFRPDLVISHWLVPSGLAAALATRSCPMLHIAHSSDVHLLLRLPFGRALARGIARSGPVLATSDALARRMTTGGLVESPVSWHLGVEPGPARARPRGPRRGPLRVVAMSRLIPNKGLRTLVRAVAAVPGVQLRIAGTGPLARPLADEVRVLGLEDRVTLVGKVLGAAKADLLASADLFACVPRPRPEAFEDNLPVTVLEAMAHGIPVLATRTGALPDLLADGAGFLTPPGSAAVAATLGDLVEADLAGAASHARALGERFSWSRSCAALEAAWAAARADG